MSLKSRAASLVRAFNPNSQWAYKALQSSPSRPTLSPVIRSEDWDLCGYKRPLAWNTAADVWQNLTHIGWLIQTHIDYTASFDLQANTGNIDYNIALNRRFARLIRKDVFDIQRRWSLPSMFRAFNSLKALNGDTIALKLPGGKCQLFEAWNIARGCLDKTITNPEQRAAAQDEIDQLNEMGLVWDGIAVQAFGIATGDDSGSLIHRQLIPWEAAIYDGYFERPSGTRPASPLLPALNFARDYLDNTAYRLVRAKIEAMFGIVLYRDHNLKGRDFNYSPSGSPLDETTTTDPSAPRPYLNYEAKSGLKLELEKDEKAEFLESKTPSSEWMAFGKELERAIFSTFRIPRSMYDPTDCTFASMLADRIKYKSATEAERRKNGETYREFIGHVLRNDWALTNLGGLGLPADVTDIEDLPYELVPTGIFLVDPEKESQAINAAVDRGQLSNESACRMLGYGDFYLNNRKLAREQQFQRDEKVMVVVGQPGQAIVNGIGVDASPGSKGDTKKPAG